MPEARFLSITIGPAAMRPEPEFAGKVAVVLGGTSGIGAGAARLLAGRGAAVVVAGRNAPAGQAVVGSILAGGGSAAFVRCDIAREDDVAALMRRVSEEWGGLDCAVNSSGVNMPPHPLHQIGTRDFDELLAVNLRGIFLAMKHQIGLMLERGGGTIVNVASTAGHVAFAGFGGYAASKHGLVGLTKVAAVDYARRNIRVNGVSPGPVDTPLLRQGLAALGQSMDSKVRSNPMERAGTVEELAEIICWLCSPCSAYVTGHFIHADGGYTLR